MAMLYGRALTPPTHQLSIPCSTASTSKYRERLDKGRHLSQIGTSTSGWESNTTCSAWFSPQAFDTSKLSVTFLPCADEGGPQLPAPRRYTLTHSDITGHLKLSIGQQYNHSQLSGWYLQFFRDEVLAEWLIDIDGHPELHLFCHISSSQKWTGPVPPALRSIVFQKEMPLVLKALIHGDGFYISQSSRLMSAPVYLHLASHVQGLNSRLEWGVLGDENSWKQPIASWFGLWWKSFVATSEPQHDTILPPQLLLHEAAKAKNSQTAMGQKPSMPKGVALEKILPAASAGCGRATAVLSEKERSPQGLGPDSVNAETLRCVASQSLAELPRQ